MSAAPCTRYGGRQKLPAAASSFPSRGTTRMSARLGENRYGESAIRLLKLTRRGDRHDLRGLESAR